MKVNHFSFRFRQVLKRSKIVVAVYRRFNILFRTSIFEDGLTTCNNSDFQYEPNFLNAYNIALQHDANKKLRWRTHVVLYFAQIASRLPGDFVECGVDRGFFARAVVEYLGFSKSNKTFYLVDTFSGLDESLVSEDDKAAFRNEYSNSYKFVCDQFAHFDNVRVIKGVVPTCLPSVETNCVSFVSIDMNCIVPEVAAFQHFYPKLTQGGIIIFDDYGFPGHEGQKLAIDEVAKSFGEAVLSLPTGQGVLIKSRSPD